MGLGLLAGLDEPPPSLSVLVEEGGTGGGRRGNDMEEWPMGRAGTRGQEETDLLLWIRRHSWQMRTWVQPARAGGGATALDAARGGGGGGVVLAPRGSSRRRCGPGPMSAGPPMAPAPPPVRGPAPLYSLPLLRRISRTRRMGRGVPRARREGWRRTPPPVLVSGRRRRERELFLQEMALRNSLSISWQTDT